MNIEKIADEIAKGIEPLLSKAQVIDRINNDEIVKRQDYLSVASGVLAQIREEIKKSLLGIEKIEQIYSEGDFYHRYQDFGRDVAQAQLDADMEI